MKRIFFSVLCVLVMCFQTVTAQSLDYAIVRIMVPSQSSSADSREFFIEVNNEYIGIAHARQYASIKLKPGTYQFNLYANTTPSGVQISNCTYEVAKNHGFSLSYANVRLVSGNVYFIDVTNAKGLSGQPSFDKALSQKRIRAGETYDLTGKPIKNPSVDKNLASNTIPESKQQSPSNQRNSTSNNKPLNNKKVKINGLYYRLQGDHATVTYQKFQSVNNYKGITSVIIPSEIVYNGISYPVTGIDNNTFYAAHSLSSITIPNSITSIGFQVFTECKALKSITLPESITWIGINAFLGCQSLSVVRIPNTVGSIGQNAFACCPSLRAFYYPEWIDVSYIGITNKAILKPYKEGDQPALAEAKESQSKSNTPSVTQQTITSQPESQKAKKQSDVDKNIVQSAIKSPNTYVLIIANENYEFLDDVKYASNDGAIFKEYCEKTLGVPQRQIFYYENATIGKMDDGISKLEYCLNNFPNTKAIVYYCGHGIPDEKSNEPFLIPIDGKGTNMKTCYSLKDLYKAFSSTKAQSITYFMDACFTGANKEGSMLVAARGVARAPEKEVLSGKTIVFSASSGDETAMTLDEQGHGLFTYYLLKKLQETEGNVTYGELADYINQNVKKDAFLINEKPQTPVVATSPAVVNAWKAMKLK